MRRLIIAARGRSRVPYLVVTIVAAFVSLVSLVPLGFIAWISVQTGWETAAKLIFRGRVGELLVNTALLELCTLPITIALSVALAWLTERTDLPGARLWSMLAVAPLAVPAFVHSYAWISLMPGLHGLTGGVLVSVLAYFPFLYLPVAAQLRRLDPAIEDAAASLGLNPWQVFFRAVLPQLRLAICGGSLLVGLHLLAEYGLYVMIRFDTFSTAIVDQFQSAFNGPAANMLAGVLVSCCLLLLVIEAVARARLAPMHCPMRRPTLPTPRGVPPPRCPQLRVPAGGRQGHHRRLSVQGAHAYRGPCAQGQHHQPGTPGAAHLRAAAVLRQPGGPQGAAPQGPLGSVSVWVGWGGGGGGG